MESGAPTTSRIANFLPMIEHELRTILNGLVGSTQVLSKWLTRNQLTQSEEIKSHLAIVNHSAHEFQMVLDQLKDYSALVQGHLQLDTHAVDFSQLLQQVQRYFVVKAKEKSIDFTVTYHPQASPIVFADASRLRQILYNLVDNAFKFTHHGKIHVDVSPTTGQQSITVSVHDEGIGIEQQQFTKLYQHFTQLYANADTKGYPGLGIGLALVKYLVEAQNGTITISSEANKGTTVTFTIPTSTVINESLKQLQQLKFLLVEQEPGLQAEMLREFMQAGLQQQHVVLEDATFLLQQCAAQWTPDIIFVTAKTFTQQLAHFARSIRANRQFRKIRIVLMLSTSAQYIYEREQALINGYDSVLQTTSFALFIESIATAWSSWQQTGEATMAVTPKQDTNKVLVVEDNVINQKVIRLLLSELGLDADIADNGQQGLAEIEKSNYAAVFVDLGLPDIHGLEVIQQLRARQDHKRDLPVIVLTADSRLSDRKDYMPKGINAYLVKPLTLKQLRETLSPFFPEILTAIA